MLVYQRQQQSKKAENNNAVDNDVVVLMRFELSPVSLCISFRVH